MTLDRILFALSLSLTACGGHVNPANGSTDATGTDYPYCSSSRGPLTADQAAGATDASLCPPPSVGNDVISATCTEAVIHLGEVGANGQGVAPDAGEWECAVHVSNGATVSP